MNIVFSVPKENLAKVKELVLGDDLLSRQSVTFKDGESLGLEGNYLWISGNDDAKDRAKEILKDLAKKLDGEQTDNVLAKIRKQEESAMLGFGNIFG